MERQGVYFHRSYRATLFLWLVDDSADGRFRRALFASRFEGDGGRTRLRLGYPYLTQRAARSIRSRCVLECGYFAEPAVHADPIHDKE